MKKLCILILTFAALFSASAEVVPMDRAKANAERFIREIAPGRDPQLRLLFEGPKMTKAGFSEPEYFIFEESKGGFVIAAGDNSVPAILGYSTEGMISVQQMPSNLRSWLDMWSRIVDGARASGAAPYTARPSGDGGSLLIETAHWDQGDPYNRQCVLLGDERPVTGCVATAMAIALRYFEYPSCGTGTAPSYTFTDEDSGKSYTNPAIEFGRPYAWSKMPLTKYDGSWTDEQIDEVAYLMRDMGAIVKAHYGKGSTGAYSEDVVQALVKYMGYDASAHLEYKNFYEDVADWVAVLKDNLDQYGPIIYSGNSEEAGHEFILDGYDENDMFHINFGWGGSGDGYYVMPAFSEYTKGHDAVLGLKKNEGGIAPDDIRLYNVGMTASTTSFASGVPFTVTCKSVANYSNEDFVGDLAIAMFDRDNVMGEIISEINPTTIEPRLFVSFENVQCVIDGSIKPGDKARMVYRSSRTTSWKPVKYDHESMIIGEIQIGDNVFLEDIVSVSYDSSTGILTVSFMDEASCELRRNGTAIQTGVSVGDSQVTIDANVLAPASYTLHLTRDGQEKDITLKFGLKK